MKKILGAFAVCICLFMGSVEVQADVIWEPRHDPFYNEYAEECIYLNRVFTTNGPDGHVEVYKDPESAEVITTWENGKNVYISFFYKDEYGTEWGIYNNGDETQSGWVRLEQMTVVYDNISFENEFAEAIVEEAGTFRNAEDKAVNFWEYPGSQSCIFMNIGEGEISYSKTFVDEAGHKWGCVGYFRALRNHWICLDAPVAEFEALYPEGAPIRGNALQEENSQVPFEVAIVTAVVAVSGALLTWVKKSLRTKNNEN
ncbi:MAG: hypothetical protein IJ379_05740 [Lachnospiraceae bacterium]|nr:hypothetical protein [Lachnospiraceae bacterium]